jgi:hypothetical protein
MAWPVTCGECIKLAEAYRSSSQWIHAAIEYRKARERAKDRAAAQDLLTEETAMLRRAYLAERAK